MRLILFSTKLYGTIFPPLQIDTIIISYFCVFTRPKWLKQQLWVKKSCKLSALMTLWLTYSLTLSDFDLSQLLQGNETIILDQMALLIHRFSMRRKNVNKYNLEFKMKAILYGISTFTLKVGYFTLHDTGVFFLTQNTLIRKKYSNFLSS